MTEGDGYDAWILLSFAPYELFYPMRKKRLMSINKGEKVKGCTLPKKKPAREKRDRKGHHNFYCFGGTCTQSTISGPSHKNEAYLLP